MFLFSAPVSAQTPRLTVQFEQNPLFSRTNFVPGEKETRFIRIANNTDTEKEIIIQVINFSACRERDCLAKALNAKVVSGADIYFDRTLADFFGAGEVSLGKLEANTTKEYEISIIFAHKESNNTYQKNNTSFDLLVGFKGEEAKIASNDPIATEGAAGIGWKVQSPGLAISNESVNNNTELDNSITITWTTSYLSYGHVIYGLDKGSSYLLDLSKPNFGYPESVPSDPFSAGHTDTEKTLDHSFVLSHLGPGTYRYRVVSHASPPTVGYEHTFTVTEKEKEPVTEITATTPVLLSDTVDENPVGTSVASGTPDFGVALEKNKLSGGTNPFGKLRVKNFAAVFFWVKNLDAVWWFYVSLSALFLWFFYKKNAKKIK